MASCLFLRQLYPYPGKLSHRRLTHIHRVYLIKPGRLVMTPRAYFWNLRYNIVVWAMTGNTGGSALAFEIGLTHNTAGVSVNRRTVAPPAQIKHRFTGRFSNEAMGF